MTTFYVNSYIIVKIAGIEIRTETIVNDTVALGGFILHGIRVEVHPLAAVSHSYHNYRTSC